MSVRIVLVGTTHPGNIGAVARAMKNMGVTDLALVNPRYFPDKEATARASGAEDLLERATVVETLPEAIADCVFVAGASARSRAIGWPCLDARDCAARLLAESSRGPVAAVFGPDADRDPYLGYAKLLAIGYALDEDVRARGGVEAGLPGDVLLAVRVALEEPPRALRPRVCLELGPELPHRRVCRRCVHHRQRVLHAVL